MSRLTSTWRAAMGIGLSAALLTSSAFVPGVMAKGGSAPGSPNRSGGGLNVFFYPFPIGSSDPLSPKQRCYEAAASSINFDWSDGGPSGCPSDYFSGYAKGHIIAPSSGTLYFCSRNDDGFVVRIGDQNVINSWTEQAAETEGCNATGSFEMQAGQTYPIQLWYYESGGYASMWLGWSDHAGDYSLVPWSSLTPN